MKNTINYAIIYIYNKRGVNMKNIVSLIIGIAIILVLPLKIYALDDTYNGHEGCTYSDINALKNKVSLVKILYDYDETTLMEITLTNLQPDFYAMDFANKVEFQYDISSENPGIASSKEYFDNQVIKINFIAAESSVCSGEEILISNIKLPRYNTYYGNELCDGIDPDKLPICSKWYPTPVEEYKFIEIVTNYKESLKETSKEIVDKVENNENDIISTILNNYMYILYGIFGISFILIIVFKIREKKKSVI